MPGLRRYVAILNLFDESRSEWTVPSLASALGAPPSTVYRAVREMVTEGFLEPASEAHYRLGAVFVEYDRLIRLTDPLYRAGKPLLREIVLQARIPCVAVLARLYHDTVMCVADEATGDGTVGTSYDRGRPRPLTLGATSKVILAQLPTRRLKHLLEAAPRGDGPLAFQKTPAEVKEELAAIRKRGYAITRGEVDKGLVGIAAPVAIAERALIGSVSLVVSSSSLDDALERRLALLVVSSASLLVEELTRRLAEKLPRAAAR